MWGGGSRRSLAIQAALEPLKDEKAATFVWFGFKVVHVEVSTGRRGQCDASFRGEHGAKDARLECRAMFIGLSRLCHAFGGCEDSMVEAG